MHRYQQRLIIVALLITFTYAAEEPGLSIQSFEAQVTMPNLGTHSTVYSNQVELWANVVSCPVDKCDCTVQSDSLPDDPQNLRFLTDKHDTGSVVIVNLEPRTNYSFTLTCKNDKTKTSTSLTVTTDYGRPLAPSNVQVFLLGTHLYVNWTAPTIPEASFHHFRVVDNKHQTTVPKTATSFTMDGDYEYGVEHVVMVDTCYVNNQKVTVCSKPAGNKFVFYLPTTTTTTTTPAPAPITTAAPIISPTPTATATTTTTPKSKGVHSYSASVLMILLSLFLYGITK